jgi:hypothetical protein
MPTSRREFGLVPWLFVLFLSACAEKPCRCPASPVPQQHISTERELFAEAHYEVVRLDASGADETVLAHHPNKYVRALALQRLEARSSPLDDAELERVAAAAGDATPLFPEHCLDALSSTDYVGQGMDVLRAGCHRSARPVGAIADEILQKAPPHRVVRAIVAHLARVNISGYTSSLRGMDGDSLLGARLRAAAARATPELRVSIVDALPRADVGHRKVLLEALSLAPLGSGTPESVDAVAPLLQSTDAGTAVLAAACILVLTDRAGDEPVPVDTEPRRTAAGVLAKTNAGSWTGESAARAIGPAAAPLLATMLEPIERALRDPMFLPNALASVRTIASLGRRGRRAAGRLFELGERVAKSRDENYEMPTVLDALGAIGAPAKELTSFVLARTSSSMAFHAGVRALVAVDAALTQEELEVLREKDRTLCTLPRHPRALDDYMKPCRDVKEELPKLEALARPKDSPRPP